MKCSLKKTDNGFIENCKLYTGPNAIVDEQFQHHGTSHTYNIKILQIKCTNHKTKEFPPPSTTMNAPLCYQNTHSNLKTSHNMYRICIINT